MGTRLIRSVKKRPILYDHKDSNFANKTMKRKAWDAVSQEAALPVMNCQKKWKGYRDTFVKRMKEMTNPSTYSPVDNKPWLYMKDMQFLACHCRYYASAEEGLVMLCENVNTSYDEDLSEQLIDHIDVDEDHTNMTNGDESRDGTEKDMDKEDVPISITREVKPSIVSSWTLQNNDFSEHQEAPSTLFPTRKFVDEDEHFCLSLVGPLRRMTEKQKSLAKLQIQQVLHNIKYANEDTEQE